MRESASINNLEELVDSLPSGEKELFQRIYAVNTAIGEQNFPPTMVPWVQQQFGSVEAGTEKAGEATFQPLFGQSLKSGQCV